MKNLNGFGNQITRFLSFHCQLSTCAKKRKDMEATTTEQTKEMIKELVGRGMPSEALPCPPENIWKQLVSPKANQKEERKV